MELLMKRINLDGFKSLLDILVEFLNIIRSVLHCCTYQHTLVMSVVYNKVFYVSCFLVAFRFHILT
jgi:hypothetical protein